VARAGRRGARRARARAAAGRRRRRRRSAGRHLATTTSTQDSGLLDVLVPLFERRTGYPVRAVAVGTGAALKLGADGNADVVLVHAPALEREYLGTGVLIDRRLVMHNDFVLVGPPADPPGSAGDRRARGGRARPDRPDGLALRLPRRPLRNPPEGAGLWKAAGVVPGGDWYVESGQGMGATLTIASEKRAYTADGPRHLPGVQKRVELRIVLEGDPRSRTSTTSCAPTP